MPVDFDLWLREWPAHATSTWAELTLSESSRLRMISYMHTHSSPLGPGLRLRSTFSENGWCDCTSYEPYLTRVTFSVGTKSFDSDGGVLYATRMLPIYMEFSDLPNIPRSFTYAEDVEEGEGFESSIEVLVLSFSGGLALILDGKRGGEKLVGIVYAMRSRYVLCAENILARSWVEYLEREICQMRSTTLYRPLASSLN
ncbi:hypothetical protein BDY19DRAFT_612991 [Irpex rosettiformis]|uniref:Uncharacterized protein n=1 Tax=Irpex rosettiformis TaxID=378272 RepID=A0ACB8TPD9_9APHY|nr:hypothetical protein BDY19DRAFT_612991 [Irpex rosettiformis]